MPDYFVSAATPDGFTSGTIRMLHPIRGAADAEALQAAVADTAGRQPDDVTVLFWRRYETTEENS
jgi:hypothetical protein